MIAGDNNHGHQRPRRLRIDEFAGGRSASAASSWYSGRRVVIAGGLVLAILWGSLYLIFRDWRTRYRARAAFGANQVATAIDPLANVVPNGVNPEAWRTAVADTHRLLVIVTASNLLDLAQMQALRADVAARVAHARPETAVRELGQLWDDLTTRAGPIITEERYPRPKLLPPLKTVTRSARPGKRRNE